MLLAFERARRILAQAFALKRSVITLGEGQQSVHCL